MKGVSMWIQSKKYILIVMILLNFNYLGCGGSTSSPITEASPKIVFSSSSDEINQGDTFIQNVEVHDLGDIFYAAFDISYDPNVIEYIGANESTFLNRDGLDSTVFSAALQNGVPGKITVGVTRLGSIGDVSGTGTLLSISFKAIRSGTTSLIFDDPKAFKNMNDEDLEINDWINGSVMIQ